jgi:hypothetical protein
LLCWSRDSDSFGIIKWVILNNMQESNRIKRFCLLASPAID